MATPGLTRTYRADVDIPAYTICKAGSGDGFVTVAAAATDRLIGPSENVPTPAGRDCDVVLEGTATCIAGGTIAAEDFITSDANGNAVTAGTAGQIYIGKAKVSAVVGDLFEVRLGFGKY